jgi:hypothetical protein
MAKLNILIQDRELASSLMTKVNILIQDKELASSQTLVIKEVAISQSYIGYIEQNITNRTQYNHNINPQ